MTREQERSGKAPCGVAFKGLKVWIRGEVTVWGGKWLSEVTQRPPGGLPSCPPSKHGMVTQDTSRQGNVPLVINLDMPMYAHTIFMDSGHSASLFRVLKLAVT